MADRRSQRTRKLLADALYGLIGEREYDLISVQDIVDRAEVARSSFYAHFRDKDDLMITGFLGIKADHAGRMFDPQPRAGAVFPSFGRDVMIGALANRQVSRALLTPAVPTVAAHHLRNLLVTQIRDWLRERYPAPAQADDVELASQYISGALMGVLVWWVRQDFPAEAEALSDRFDQLAFEGLRHLGAPA